MWKLCKKITGGNPGGGGGGTQIWFRRGCAAEAAKPVPIFKGHFGGKGYPLLGVWRKRVPIIRGFYSRKWCFLCTLATKWAKISRLYSKITKVGGMFRDFPAQTIPHVQRFLGKKSPISAAHPRSLLGEYPPPPPPPPGRKRLHGIFTVFAAPFKAIIFST